MRAFDLAAFILARPVSALERLARYGEYTPVSGDDIARMKAEVAQ